MDGPVGFGQDHDVDHRPHLYDDGRIICDGRGLTIRWYYPWGGKHIPYGTIRSASTFSLDRMLGRWRLWGSGDFVHWYNLDGGRPRKHEGIDIDTGGRIHPCITPDDVEAVSRIIGDHLPG